MRKPGETGFQNAGERPTETAGDESVNGTKRMWLSGVLVEVASGLSVVLRGGSFWLMSLLSLER